MSSIIQNVKSGFANMKELFRILLSDDIEKNDYDSYINGNDKDLAQTAQELKELEEKQEAKRLSFFNRRRSAKRAAEAGYIEEDK